ncbi:MAG: adenylyltransferase/cytidyltransferase family protein [Promethearchaeota archaeon]
MKKKILVAGTFDILHPGHIFLINEAAKLGDVYIVIATDKNRELYSGEAPIVPEQQRFEVMKSIKNVKDVILGRHDNDTLRTVEEINPDIILLGPDQKFSAQKLQNALKMKGLNHIEVRRLEKYYDKFKLHSSSLIKKKIFEKYKKNHS